MRPTGSPQELERRRHAALTLLKTGLLPHQVAKRLDVDRRSVRRWRAAYRQGGVRGVAAQPASGRPSRLTTTVRDRLRQRLLAGARACGFDTDLWTCPRVAQVIARDFGVRYHPDHVNRLLHRLGFSPQRPARRALERNERKIRQWVTHTWEATKKKSVS